MAEAIFAAGCFWGVEDAFRQVGGVTDVEVGYTAGSLADPSYEQVCTGTTGHTEAVRVQFDPDRASYEQLLDAFWSMHDPTTIDRQGPDVGTQYRSGIYFTTPEQQESAISSKKAQDASDRFKRPIVTEIEPASEFYRAEEYHQQYFARKGISSCRF